MVTSSSRFQPNRADRKVSDVFIQHTNLLEERLEYLSTRCTPGRPSVRACQWMISATSTRGSRAVPTLAPWSGRCSGHC